VVGSSKGIFVLWGNAGEGRDRRNAGFDKPSPVLNFSFFSGNLWNRHGSNKENLK
jgi:hypothetical protein